MLEHAVKAMIRVREVIRGRSSSVLSATEYGLLGFVGEGRQYLITAPRRAASFLYGPLFADRLSDHPKSRLRALHTFVLPGEDEFIACLDIVI